MTTNRRDFMRWVLYLGATAALPALGTKAEDDQPHDVLEGISRVEKRLVDLSGNAAKFRLKEETAFEGCMRDMWREYNGSARYVRVMQDHGLQPARDYRIQETGEIVHEPEGYVTFFQYRRA